MPPPLLAGALVLLLWAGARPQHAPDPHWGAWITEVPLVDLSGVWVFDPGRSDPMLPEWRDVRVEYHIRQDPSVIRLDFMPDGVSENVQTYRWDGSIVAFQRGGAEVRERARWEDGGRTLRVEGRRWNPGDAEAIAYQLIYTLESPDLLVFRQHDQYGDTVWRFRRSRQEEPAGSRS